MRQVWLRQNTSALMFGMIVPTMLAFVGLSLSGIVVPIDHPWIHWVGWALLIPGGVLAGLLFLEVFRPRLSYANGRLLVHVRAGPPYRVPIEAVECFLLGQGPALLPGKRNRDHPTVTLVIRLAEKAEDWAQRETKSALASWCGGQITLRGTWCEPLDVKFVTRLNARLDETQRAWRKQQVAS
ncbi:MAG: hypothetical protein AB7O62_06175 [Pirellulales bacterium]